MRLDHVGLLGIFLSASVMGCGGSDEGFKPPANPVVNAPMDKDLQAQLERQIHSKPAKKVWKPNSR